jgi:hypothetical protein
MQQRKMGFNRGVQLTLRREHVAVGSGKAFLLSMLFSLSLHVEGLEAKLKYM